MSDYPAKGDPWADFLHHRVRLLAMFRADGKTPQEICGVMGMSPLQVESILDHYDSHRDEFDTLPKASKDSASACPYWSDKVHCYTTWGTWEKVCRCGSTVGPRAHRGGL